MADEATWKPKIPREKYVPKRLPCAACGGQHASHWGTVPAPSCAERQKRKTA